MPDSLGKVKISMDINKNVIHAHAEVENEAARSLMQNNIENLKQSLVQQGMQLNSLNISLSNQQEQKSSKSFQSKRKPVYSEQVKKIDEKENINVSKHYGYNTYEFLA
jgi:flagellar hook-length control protein FliK